MFCFLYLYSFFLGVMVHGSPVYWASHPVLSRESVMVAVSNANYTRFEIRPFISGFGKASAVRVEVAAATPNGAVLVHDSNATSGPFEILANGSSEGYYNIPEPWFVIGDGGDSSTPSGWIRVVGRALSAPRLPCLLVMQQIGPVSRRYERTTAFGDAHTDRYSAHFELAGAVPLGAYRLFVGAAGLPLRPLCVFEAAASPCVDQWTVADPPAIPKNVFAVRVPQPGIYQNATLAISVALEKASRAGGGIVELPRGQYMVTGMLRIPRNTIVRGAGRHLSSLTFHFEGPATAPTAGYIAIEESDVVIEDLAIYIVGYMYSGIRVHPGVENVLLHRLLLRFNPYLGTGPPYFHGGGSSGSPAWGATHLGEGDCIKVAGRGVRVLDNDMYCAGNGVSSLFNGGVDGVSYMIVARNKLRCSNLPYWGISWKQVLFEDNVMTSWSPWSDGANLAQYFNRTDGNPSVQNVLHRNNTFDGVWGLAREMMTLDGGGGVFYGHLSAWVVEGSEGRLTLPSPGAVDCSPSGVVCVVVGLGTGQCYRLLFGGVCNTSNTRFTTFGGPSPDSVDASSKVVIIPYVGRIVFEKNSYADGSAVQLFAQAVDFVAADNYFTRVGQLSAWGFQEQTTVSWDPNLRVEFINNTIDEGNHAMVYQEGVRYDATEAYFFKTRTGSQGNNTADLYLDRFIVFRRSVGLSNTGVYIQGTAANVLVESVTIAQSDVGIVVDNTTLGVLVRNVTELFD